MKCEKVTIEAFMEVWFDSDYTNLSQEDFELVYSEYIDLAGLFQTKEYELTVYINYLKNRIHVLKTVLYTEQMYYDTFKAPHIPILEFIRDKFGFAYEWKGNETSLFSFLRKLENQTRTKKTELRRKEFELEKLKEAKSVGDVSKVQSRHEFIKMLNSLNKNGYRINREKTKVEELALIIKQVSEESEKIKMENKIKTR